VGAISHEGRLRTKGGWRASLEFGRKLFSIQADLEDLCHVSVGC